MCLWKLFLLILFSLVQKNIFSPSCSYFFFPFCPFWPVYERPGEVRRGEIRWTVIGQRRVDTRNLASQLDFFGWVSVGAGRGGNMSVRVNMAYVT